MLQPHAPLMSVSESPTIAQLHQRQYAAAAVTKFTNKQGECSSVAEEQFDVPKMLQSCALTGCKPICQSVWLVTSCMQPIIRLSPACGAASDGDISRVICHPGAARRCSSHLRAAKGRGRAVDDRPQGSTRLLGAILGWSRLRERRKTARCQKDRHQQAPSYHHGCEAGAVSMQTRLCQHQLRFGLAAVVSAGMASEAALDDTALIEGPASATPGTLQDEDSPMSTRVRK